MSNTDEKDD